MYRLKRRVYEEMPGPLKRSLGCIPFGWIAGKSYRRTLASGKTIDFAGREDILAMQERLLGDMLSFVTAHVPAYRNLKEVVSQRPPFEALKAFPLLGKDELQRNCTYYLPEQFAKIPHYDCTTGGTTGNQLTLYLDDDSQSIEMGFMHRQWTRIGYRATDRKATFRGVEFGNLVPGRYWQSNPIYNEMQFSPYHLGEKTLPAYWGQLAQFRPAYLHGYPSAIALLADLCRRFALPAGELGIRGVLLGSEQMLPGQRELIEQVFGARVFSWYGHSERVILAGECEHASAYHSFPDYGVIEIVDENDQAVPIGERGELIGTGLLNRSMPLVRYRTGDFARRLDWRCSCGRAFDRFDNVEGRWHQEFILGKSGSRMSLAALNVHGPVFDHVLRYQYVQDSPGAMTINVMVDEQYGAHDGAGIVEQFRRKVGDELEVIVAVVEDIPLTKRGKFRRLVQKC